MKLVNLMPKTIDIYNEDDTLLMSVPASGTVALPTIGTSRTLLIDGIEIGSKTFGEIENLPEPDGETIYIVDTLVATLAWAMGRTDVVCKLKPKCDEHGKIIGTYGLAVHP